MTTPTFFIAGDWGTSALRLWLCRDGVPVDRVDGPGVAAAAGRLDRIFLAATLPWREAEGDLPALLCGMVGSSIGWVEAAYQPCPADLGSLARGLTRFQAEGEHVAIVPGLSCTNPLGAPDVMRGEETQILGALACDPDLGRGRRLLCLPGTHNKWVRLDNGRVQDFQTCLSGEMFALLRQHSVLGRDTDGLSPQVGTAFTAGVVRALTGAPLTHLLFEARSRRLLEGLSAQDALSFLSGLIIGSDVAGARTLAAAGTDGPILLIGAPALTDAYGAALAIAGLDATARDGDDLVLAGLRALYGALTWTN